MPPDDAQQLHSILALDRIWWVKDPVPPWIRNILDKVQLVELAQVELHLQASILRAQLDAHEKAIQILGKARK